MTKLSENEAGLKVGTRTKEDVANIKKQMSNVTFQMTAYEKLYASDFHTKNNLAQEWVRKSKQTLEWQNLTVEVLPKKPFLTNMSKDPVMTGRLRFVIPSVPKQLTVGSDKSNNIVLSAGFPKKLCYLQTYGEPPSHVIFLEVSAGGVWVDGKPQGPPGVKVTVNNGATVVFAACGSYYGFKLFMPDGFTPIPKIEYVDIEADLVKTITPTPEVLAFAQQFEMRATKEAAALFLNNFKRSTFLVKEANEQLSQVGKPDVEFSLDCVHSLMPTAEAPQIIVKLKRKPSAAINQIENAAYFAEPIACFTLAQFESRTKMMRELIVDSAEQPIEVDSKGQPVLDKFMVDPQMLRGIWYHDVSISGLQELQLVHAQLEAQKEFESQQEQRKKDEEDHQKKLSDINANAKNPPGKLGSSHSGSNKMLIKLGPE